MASPDNPLLFFPRSWHERDASGVETEITLRDLFAGMAMQALLADRCRRTPSDLPVPSLRKSELAQIAAFSLEQADAMLEARDDAS